MKKIYIILIVLFISLLGIGIYIATRVHQEPVANVSGTQQVEVPKVPEKDCSVSDDAVIKAVNDERIKIGVKPLVFNVLLDKFADERATEQPNGIDNHAGFQPKLNLWGNMGYLLVAEDQNQMVNVPGEPCNNAYDRIQHFRISEKHWTSLMNPRYDTIGIGFYKNVLNINLGDLK